MGLNDNLKNFTYMFKNRASSICLASLLKVVMIFKNSKVY